MTAWHEGPLCVFDTESTGVDVRKARIVTGYAATILGAAEGRRVRPGADVLINPGVDIPEEATRMHGVTNEMAREKGCTPAEGIYAIVEALGSALKARIPIVGFNLAYDFGLLYHECLRHDVITLAEMLGKPPNGMFGPVIDAHVLDKHVDPYRKGSRKLDDSKGPGTATHYGVPLTAAHTADADAIASARVAVRIASLYPEIGKADLGTLWLSQRRWRAEQMASLTEYFRTKKKEPDAWCDPCWPYCITPEHAEP